MKKFIIGKKAGMTQMFDEEGRAIPVTVIECEPMTVIQKKTVENDGYTAVKVGYEDIPEKKLSKPALGQFSKSELPPKKHLREFKTELDLETGSEIKVGDMFEKGDKVDVSGVSKGKGFAGAIKRHNQRIGPKSHGSTYFRRVGSMGAMTHPGRVFKGKKLPGHMGAVNVTVQNLEVVSVDKERNILVLKGAVPGPKGRGILEIKESVKSAR